MRYKEGEIPPELLARHASDDMLLFTAALSFLIGLLMIWMGRRGKQLWIWTWGAGLTVLSVYLWLVIKFDFKLFQHF